MNILLGVADYNPGVKDYALPKLYENLEVCTHRVCDVLFVSDRDVHPFPTHVVEQPKSFHSEDVLYHAREYIRAYAEKMDYDAFIWQGSDCYYNSRWDFCRFLWKAHRPDVYAIGALTSARTDSHFPVARRFTGNGTEQRTISDAELLSGSVIPCYGFPGADALLIKKPLISESWMQWKNFRPWYELREDNPHSLCAEEFWCYKVGKKYPNSIWLDTSVRTWHVHDVDRIARRWPGEEKPLEELSWT